jgi:hypothetical protein
VGPEVGTDVGDEDGTAKEGHGEALVGLFDAATDGLELAATEGLDDG